MRPAYEIDSSHHDRLRYTHIIRDEVEAYRIVAPDWGVQAIADEFLKGYAIHDDIDDGTDVQFSVASIEWVDPEEDIYEDTIIGRFLGRPDEPARRRG